MSKLEVRTKFCIKVFLYNAKNFLKFGLKAPRYKERIWVKPKDVKHRLTTSVRKKHFRNIKLRSGKVIDGQWDSLAVDFAQKSLYKDCYEHWIEGAPWEKTIRYDRMMKKINKHGQSDGCETFVDVKKRYKRLDNIFKQIKKEGRFRTQEEIENKKRFFAKGRGEIEIWIDRKGNPIHGCGGNHRLAIAKILDLDIIPAKLGIVHPDGIKFLPKYREPPNDR